MTVLFKGTIINEYWKQIVAKIDANIPLTSDERKHIEGTANQDWQMLDGFIDYRSHGEWWSIDLRPYMTLYWVDAGNPARIRQVAAFSEGSARSIAEYQFSHRVERIIMVQAATKTL